MRICSRPRLSRPVESKSYYTPELRGYRDFKSELLRPYRAIGLGACGCALHARFDELTSQGDYLFATSLIVSRLSSMSTTSMILFAALGPAHRDGKLQSAFSRDNCNASPHGAGYLLHNVRLGRYWSGSNIETRYCIALLDIHQRIIFLARSKVGQMTTDNALDPSVVHVLGLIILLGRRSSFPHCYFHSAGRTPGLGR